MSKKSIVPTDSASNLVQRAGNEEAIGLTRALEVVRLARFLAQVDDVDERVALAPLGAARRVEHGEHGRRKAEPLLGSAIRHVGAGALWIEGDAAVVEALTHALRDDRTHARQATLGVAKEADGDVEAAGDP